MNLFQLTDALHQIFEIVLIPYALSKHHTRVNVFIHARKYTSCLNASTHWLRHTHTGMHSHGRAHTLSSHHRGWDLFFLLRLIMMVCYGDAPSGMSCQQLDSFKVTYIPNYLSDNCLNTFTLWSSPRPHWLTGFPFASKSLLHTFLGLWA
jgi:hypothetical protein